MKRMRVFFLLILCGCTFSNAQQVASSGGYSVESGVSVDWILGGNLLDMAAYEVNGRSKEALPESGFSCKIYPTLASDFFTIEIVPSDSLPFILELYDISGTRIINSSYVNQPVRQVDIADLPPGAYILKVWFPGHYRLLEVAKIVKN